jgi:hypothetical protein
MIEKCFLGYHCTFDGAMSRPVTLLFFVVWFLHLVWCFTALISTAQEKKTNPIMSMEKTKCIWTVGLGEEDSRYITKRLVFLLLGWMDGCCLGVDIPMCCVLLLLRPSSHPVQSKRFVEEERVGFIGNLGFVCSGILGVEHMGTIMGHEKVLNFHSLL